VYEDGSEWCFGCHARKPPTQNIDSVVNHFKEKKERGTNVILPSDLSYSIPKEPYEWLKQYDITDAEIAVGRLSWSEKERMLIFPYYGEGRLLIWQGRYFPKQKVKNYTKGDVDSVILLPQYKTLNNERIVCVEDPVSALKVSRYCIATPLLGSYLSRRKAKILSTMFYRLTLWLDFDKGVEAIKFSNKYKDLFDIVDVVFTEKDPKLLTDEEIIKELNL
jgi:hypothetical protein